MLPAAHRLTDSESFRRATRRGRRSSSRTLVAHLLTEADAPDATRVGFVVSKAVGNAVVRNRVQRRLRHLAVSHVDALPLGSLLVVRALPAAATASYAELGEDLDRSLARAGVRA